MKAGFIGAGRAGCSLGKYLSGKGQTVVGFYDSILEAAENAAEFVGTRSFQRIDELVCGSGILFLTTPDGEISRVWEEVRTLPLSGKILCHCSGAQSSEVFSGIEETGAKGVSLHPMLPFSNRFSSYQQLEQAFFTIEGSPEAVLELTERFSSFGNRLCRIDSACKTKYHAAASILSNQVVAVLDTGFRLLEECGFSREEALAASGDLISRNVENVLNQDCINALTGPIERNDTKTVEKHLDSLTGEDGRMYRLLGQKLVQIAARKNPGQDYSLMDEILKGDIIS